MPDDLAPVQPKPPEGMQRPGIPGAGNLLDPEVRGKLREQVHEAAHGAGAQLRGQAPAAPPADAAAAPTATQAQHRAGPYPHGDVDLSFISANVSVEPVKPSRGTSSRRFYFLADEQETPASKETPSPVSQNAPKPG